MNVTVDPLYSTTRDKTSLPLLLSPGRLSSHLALQTHDIDAADWLSEIGMSMYIDVFLVNFAMGGSRILSRTKLSRVHLEHLPKMGIQQYHHQKIIMEHIRHTLKFEFNSPIRKREVEAKMNASSSIRGDGEGSTKVFRLGKLAEIPERTSGAAKKQFADHGKKAGPTRRRSFDKNVWQSISKLRTSDAASLAAVDALREGNFLAAERLEAKSHDKRRRRRTYGEDDEPGRTGKDYGNRVQLFDILQRELHELQVQHLEKLQRVVKCEKTHIFFINEKSRELLLATEVGMWFRCPPGSGFAGYAIDHGMPVNVPFDACNDPRFNVNLDLKCGWKTRNVLCQPLRGNRGGGIIIGVVQCMNKLEGEFDEDDEEHLAVCCQRIGDALHSQYRDLLNIAEHMSGTSIYVAPQGRRGHGSEVVHDVTQPTAASLAQAVQPFLRHPEPSFKL